VRIAGPQAGDELDSPRPAARHHTLAVDGRDRSIGRDKGHVTGAVQLAPLVVPELADHPGLLSHPQRLLGREEDQPLQLLAWAHVIVRSRLPGEADVIIVPAPLALLAP